MRPAEPSPRELAAGGRFDKLGELLLDDRDALLVQALAGHP